MQPLAILIPPMTDRERKDALAGRGIVSGDYRGSERAYRAASSGSATRHVDGIAPIQAECDRGGEANSEPPPKSEL
jgi:hypothetical protein